MAQFLLRLNNMSGLPSEIAAALWQKGVRIKSFSAEVQQGKQTLRLAVDNREIAKETFIEHGWTACEERESPRPS